MNLLVNQEFIDNQAQEDKVLGKQGWTCGVCDAVNKRKSASCTKCSHTKHERSFSGG